MQNDTSLWADNTPNYSKGQKRAFIWGMAMHIAADVFAHSAFVKSGGIWRHLAHGDKHNGKEINNYADKTGKYKERYQAAGNVVREIVAKYDSKNGIGSYVQFKGMCSVGKTFRLKDLSAYVNKTDSSSNLGGLTYFDISAGPFDYFWAG